MTSHPTPVQPWSADGRDASGEYDQRLRVEGTGPPLIFVPGIDGTGRLFHRQVPRLISRFRVATYSLRDDAGCMETLVDDLARVVRTVAPESEPAVVIGESFGGTLAMTFALTHPRLVRALVILNSFPHFVSQLRLRLALGAVSLMPWRAMATVRRLTAFRLHSRRTHHADVRHYLEQTKKTTRRGYVSRLRILRDYDIRARLAEIDVPTLFLAADRDHVVPSVAHARYMAGQVENATLRILSGHGHACLVAPDVDLGQMLGEWLPGRWRSDPDQR